MKPHIHRKSIYVVGQRHEDNTWNKVVTLECGHQVTHCKLTYMRVNAKYYCLKCTMESQP